MKRIIPFAIALSIGFGAGMYTFYDPEYRIEHVEEQDYLCSRTTEQCEVITEDFQLGSLEYRIDGIRDYLRENEQLFR